jgi:hypothetical protein
MSGGEGRKRAAGSSASAFQRGPPRRVSHAASSGKASMMPYVDGPKRTANHGFVPGSCSMSGSADRRNPSTAPSLPRRRQEDDLASKRARLKDAETQWRQLSLSPPQEPPSLPTVDEEDVTGLLHDQVTVLVTRPVWLLRS